MRLIINWSERVTKYIIGVDGGGSKTHAVLVDAHKNIIDECFYGAANINTNFDVAYSSITAAINELVLRNNLTASSVKIGIGVAGYSVLEKRAQLLALLTKDYAQIKVNSDCHIACLAAHSGKDGMIIICGTGVVAYYIKDKQAVQIGGWGFPHGDIGGAAWLGLEICRYTCQAIDGVIAFTPLLTAVWKSFDENSTSYKSWLLNAKPSDYATLAKLLPQFKTTDSLAQQILTQATKQVIAFTRAAIKREPDLPVSLVGGLAPLFIPSIKEQFAAVMLSKQLPAVGACFL